MRRESIVESSPSFVLSGRRAGCESSENAKVPFGTAKFSKIKNVRYLSWEDAFDVEFEDGFCILEPHSTIRRANKISPGTKFDRLEIEDWTQSGFFVHYDNGQTAEVSW